jgi:hypothetical protein
LQAGDEAAGRRGAPRQLLQSFFSPLEFLAEAGQHKAHDV